MSAAGIFKSKRSGAVCFAEADCNGALRLPLGTAATDVLQSPLFYVQYSCSASLRDLSGNKEFLA
jgi:hypothetical protein